MATAPDQDPPTAVAMEVGEAVTPEALAAIATMTVYDEDGGEAEFGSLHESQKTIIVFVRVSPKSCIP